MTKQEFAEEFERLLASQPYFKPENRQAVTRLWYEMLQKFPVEDVREIFTQIIHEAPEFLPHIGKVAKRCEEAENSRRAKIAEERRNNCKVCKGLGWAIFEKNGSHYVRACECSPQELSIES